MLAINICLLCPLGSMLNTFLFRPKYSFQYSLSSWLGVRVFLNLIFIIESFPLSLNCREDEDEVCGSQSCISGAHDWENRPLWLLSSPLETSCYCKEPAFVWLDLSLLPPSVLFLSSVQLLYTCGAVSVAVLRGKASPVEMLSSEGKGYPWKYSTWRKWTLAVCTQDYHKVTPHNKSHTESIWESHKRMAASAPARSCQELGRRQALYSVSPWGTLRDWWGSVAWS